MSPPYSDSATLRLNTPEPAAITDGSFADQAYRVVADDIFKPVANAAVVEPVNTAIHGANWVTRTLTGHDAFSEVTPFKMKVADPYSAEWAIQNLSTGVGALVPYTIAGKMMGGAMRTAGAKFEARGMAANLLKSEKIAFIGGAFAYDGLRNPHEGETRLGNALGGAAGFAVFGKGNEWSKGFTPAGKLAARVATGFVGADTGLTVSSLVSRHELPSFEEYAQAGISGGMMNFVLPSAQDYITRKMTGIQLNTQRGAPVDQYLTDNLGGTEPGTTLGALVETNPWARVRKGEYADFDRSRNVLEVQAERQDTGVVARGLAHLVDARTASFEPGYKSAASLLAEGKTNGAWEAFRQTRATQETSAHQSENVSNNETKGTTVLKPEHMNLEIGAWPAPGGISYEARWRQEFIQFAQSEGNWRAGDPVTTQSFDPAGKSESTTPARELTEAERTSLAQREQATSLIRDLQKKGFIAVLAGGSVRDEVMGKIPKDFDIATSADPDTVQRLFESKGYRVILTGKQFGVINVVANGETYEIASLRNDGQYSDGRRPDGVTYVSSLYEDAARRDLTMNAMFKDPTVGTTYDFFGGNSDIANKQIRTVGDPNRRFAEDNLRMMRVPRFASRYEGFTVAPETVEAIKANADKISTVSSERVRDELRGILTSQHPLTGLDLMMDTGLMRNVLPEVVELTGPKAMQDPIWHPEGSTWAHTRLVLQGLTAQGANSRFETMLGGLLHDIGKPGTQEIKPDGRITNYGHAELGADMSRDISNRLKLSNVEKDRVVKLVAEHMKMHTVQDWRRSKLLDLFASPYVDDHIALQHADAMGTGRGGAEAESKSNRDWLLQKRSEVAATEDPALQLGAKPIVDGKFLISMGVKAGPRLGEIKNAAFEAQREGAFNDVESAKKWLAETYPR